MDYNERLRDIQSIASEISHFSSEKQKRNMNSKEVHDLQYLKAVVDRIQLEIHQCLYSLNIK